MHIEDESPLIFSGLRNTNDDQKLFIADLQKKGTELLSMLDELPDCRRKAIAITHIETAIMFATKATCYGK